VTCTFLSWVSFGAMGAIGVSLAGCEAPKPVPAEQVPVHASTSALVPSGATAGASASSQAFGAALSDATPFVSLADIYKDPQVYAGKRVRTRGQVVAVCQAAGCWCDLRPETDDPTNAALHSPVTHVMMHDHAFLLPKTSKSRLADVEGTLAVKALSQAEVDHYNAEGASLVAGAPMVNVDAVGVVLR